MLLEKGNNPNRKKGIQMAKTDDSIKFEQELENLEDEFDNPQRAQLSSNFLLTYVEASNCLTEGYKNSEGKFIKSHYSKFGQTEILSVFREIANFIQHECPGSDSELHIKQYKFLMKLGEGSFGKVFKVQDRLSGEIKAIKIMKKRKNMSYNREREIITKLSHENIIKMYQYFESDRFSYLVMEYCDGNSPILKMKTINETCNESFSKEFIKQILKGLDYLHKKSIVHRDIKLENIVFSENKNNNVSFTAKIIDFGNSNEMKFQVNQTEELYGTTVYMPPEAFSGCYTSTFDIWSCGVILYILLSGIYPFKRQSQKESEEAIKNFKISFENEVWSKVNPAPKDLLKQMLTKDYLKRPSASECLSHNESMLMFILWCMKERVNI